MGPTELVSIRQTPGTRALIQTIQTFQTKKKAVFHYPLFIKRRREKERERERDRDRQRQRHRQRETETDT